MERAEEQLASLVGTTVPALTLNSIDAEDAPFLGRITSKLSPIIGNLLERQIIELLTDDTGSGMRWVRQDPNFPDALLLDRAGVSTNAGYEVKAWFVMSTELTGRFRESVRLLENRHIKVAVIAWHLSHIVYGTPKIAGILTVDALSVAECRDTHYHNPPDYLCVEPQDTSQRTRNLRQTNVSGFKWQSTDSSQRSAAEALVRKHEASDSPSHTPKAQEMVVELMNLYPYRLDTNFAKIDRIDHAEIEAFKRKMLSTKVRKRSLSDWTRLLRDLRDTSSASYAAAATEIQNVYSEL